MKKTPSKTSPKNGRKGCLCPDGKTYSRECCDGSLQAQGIGSTQEQGTSTVNNTNAPRTTTTNNG